MNNIDILEEGDIIKGNNHIDFLELLLQSKDTDFYENNYQQIDNDIKTLISENKELKEENIRLKHSITKATEIIDEYANETENDTKKLIEYQEKYLNN